MMIEFPFPPTVTNDQVNCNQLNHVLYHESAYDVLGLLAVSQARTDAENGDCEAYQWLIDTGCEWLSILGAGERDIEDMSREVTANLHKAGARGRDTGLQESPPPLLGSLFKHGHCKITPRVS